MLLMRHGNRQAQRILNATEGYFRAKGCGNCVVNAIQTKEYLEVKQLTFSKSFT